MSGKSSDKQKVTEYFEKKLNRKLSDAEILECIQSLYYLGRAIYKFNLQKQGANNG